MSLEEAYGVGATLARFSILLRGGWLIRVWYRRRLGPQQISWYKLQHRVGYHTNRPRNIRGLFWRWHADLGSKAWTELCSSGISGGLDVFATWLAPTGDSIS